MNKLTSKVAIVTGASKGIGAAIANGLAEVGAAVAVNCSADKECTERTVLQITRSGGRAITLQADVSKAADVKRLFEETEKPFGSVDVLVNNAGSFNSSHSKRSSKRNSRCSTPPNPSITIARIKTSDLYLKSRTPATDLTAIR